MAGPAHLRTKALTIPAAALIDLLAKEPGFRLPGWPDRALVIGPGKETI